MKQRTLLLAAAAAAGTLLLAVALVSGVRSLLAYPLTYIAWLINQVYSYTPSWAIWGLLLLGMLILAMESLIKPFSLPESENEKSMHRLHRRVTQLISWLNQRSRPFYRHQINHELTELTARILAQRRHSTAQDVRNAIRSQQIELPPGLSTYLEQGLTMWANDDRRSSRLTAFLQPRPAAISEKDDADMERALTYLEDLMEVNHDPGYFNRRSD